ncbi:hypothetical protein [Fodinibius sediminis]|uniref:Carboxypeptidase regulatory-like domain-containing protein n=1 Tax=Fodinibius sediminis TaxID=1214077 RepID=A0A521AZM0_9BACT|nr:hypothetical protein [Fodinibius sediminis]SMO40304.1 hypothetical protein SAMN06265218_10233 [Fodinibius sediminis]
MKSKQIRNLVLVLATAMLSFACSDFTTSSDNSSGNATVNGQVEKSEANKAAGSRGHASVEGATVTVARITTDGSLESIGNAQAKTNAQGEFSLEVDANAATNASEKIIVRAEKSGQQWKAFLYDKLQNGSSIELKPLTVESTGEANVYQEVVANDESGLVSKADIEAYIDAEAGTAIKENGEAASAFAEALVEEAHARARYFADQGIEVTEEQLEEIKDVKAEALANLNASLYASSSQSARAEAYGTFISTIASAHVEAGVDADAYAKAKKAANTLVVEKAAELSDAAQSEIRAKAALLVAVAVDNAVQARMKAAEAADASVQAAVDAGMELRSALRTKTMAGASEVKSLFAAYNQTIMDLLKQEFSASSETIVSINSEVNGTAGAKATLESNIEASADTEAIVEAYTTFYSTVESLVDNLLTLSSDAEAEVVADLLILINIGN